jgi:hypothetical protein
LLAKLMLVLTVLVLTMLVLTVLVLAVLVLTVLMLAVLLLAVLVLAKCIRGTDAEVEALTIDSVSPITPSIIERGRLETEATRA